MMVVKREDVTEPIEWTREYLVDVLGVVPHQADFMLAIQHGKIKSDIVEEGTTGSKEFDQKQEKRDTTLGAASSRLPMWINRYREVRTQAQTMACSDQKLMWVLGPSENHCPSCSKLAGKVKRGSVWRAAGIQPRIFDLACHGFNCLCELVPTNEPSSRGPLPRLP